MLSPEAAKTTNWKDALEEQERLWSYWRTDAYGEALRLTVNLRVVIDDPPSAEVIHSGIERLLLTAEPIHVAADMCDLVAAARESLPWTEPLEEYDLLTPAGFVFLAKPLYVTEALHGMKVPMRAFAWEKLIFSDEEGLREPWHGVHYGAFASRWREDWFEDPGARAHRAHLPATSWAFQPFGKLPADALMQRYEEPALREASWYPIFLSFLRLASQTIAERSRQRPDRAARRRFQKWRPEHDAHVTVVRLRRRRHEGEPEESGRTLDHRHLVSGYWRQTWFPSLGRNKLQWISDYVRGPDDAPLRVRAGRVWEWDR